MAVTQRVKAAAPVVDRLLKDRQVQDQLVDAGDHLQQVYRRVSRRKAKAAEDKKVYAHVRKGVVALRKAGTTATQRRRRPWGKWLVLAVVAGGAVVVFANQGARTKVMNAIGGTTSSADGAGTSPDPAAAPA
jgi:hypothetical protein